MNQSKNILRIGICSLLLLGLAACHQNPRTTDAENTSQTQISSTRKQVLGRLHIAISIIKLVLKKLKTSYQHIWIQGV